MSEEFDFESIKKKAIEQIEADKPSSGKNGSFAPFVGEYFNATLESETDARLFEDGCMNVNRRNDKMRKQVRISS